MWNADRTMYGSETLPDALERALLEAHAKVHWENIKIRQHLRDIANKDKSHALAT